MDSLIIYYEDDSVKEDGVFMHVEFTVNLRKAFEITVRKTVGKGWSKRWREVTQVIFIFAPCILIYVEFTHQQKHFFDFLFPT